MVEKTKTLENDIINRETKVRDDFQENLGKTKQFLQKKSVTAFKKLQNDLKGLEKSSQEAIRDLEANLASTKSELLLNSETALQTLEARMKIKDDDIKKELFDNIIDLEQNSKAAIQNLEDDLTQTKNGFKNNFINFEGTLKAQYKGTVTLFMPKGERRGIVI